eukprot:scaffold60711_cov65-Attheya_sp.AAC.13
MSAGHCFACDDLEGQSMDPVYHGRVVCEELLLDIWVCQGTRNDGVAIDKGNADREQDNTLLALIQIQTTEVLR